MSTALHYKSNLRDLYFNLFEFLDIGATSLGQAPFGDLDQDATRETLRVLDRLAVEELAPSFTDADRTPLILDGEGNVTLPKSLSRSIDAYYDAEMHLLALPARLGGMGAPPTVAWAAFELVAAANSTAGFYLFGTSVARVVDAVGTEAQKKRFVRNVIDRRWGGTMVLTEPDAGSDVGAGRTKARAVGGGEWELEGVKRFITNGDFNGPENIVHLVLARPEGAVAGTKGLSMFIVPKFWVEEDGRLGARNGVYCTNVEKKMGIKGSATCEMTFGERHPARALLVGEVHDGIRQMFLMIEHARMAVGIKSVATLSTAYLNALAFARDRIQGSDLLRARDKSAPRVPILRHPDVRRMLMMQRAHVEGMRALALYTAHVQDRIELAGGHGSDGAAPLELRNDLLLPLVKGYCSDRCYELLALSLQCFGGSGFLQDYPIEQYIRDQKIDSLYEGTTHIQALDLLLRKVARDGGATLRALLDEVRATVEKGADGLAPERAALGRALGDLDGIFAALLGKMGESLYHVGLQGNRVLFALAELVIGWLLVRQGEVALARRDANPSGRAFYDGKLAAVRFYCRNVLPGIALARRLVEESTLDLTELSDESF